MAYEVMQRTPLLVRWMAVDPLVLLLGLAIIEGESASDVGHQSTKD